MLHELQSSPGAIKTGKRKGRGQGSTLGKTGGRGQKGQYARSTVRRGFEGGQTPLYRRLPRRGFKNPFRETFAVVNLWDLANCKALAKVKEIDPQAMVEAGLIQAADKKVKVLAVGELKKALTIKAHQFSRASADKITQAGGTAVVIEG